MSQQPKRNKRPSSDPAASIPKRVHNSKSHVQHCTDPDCTGCASGSISLGEEIMLLSPEQITAIADQEILSENKDRNVIIKLYETALLKFGSQKSLHHAWALLQLAEYVDFVDYATEALAIIENITTDDSLQCAQISLIRSRSSILEVCLNPENTSDQCHSEHTHHNHHNDADSSIPFSGHDKVVKSSDHIIKALQQLCAAEDRSLYNNYTTSTLASLLARVDNVALKLPLKYAIADILQKTITTLLILDQTPAQEEGKKPQPTESNDEDNIAELICLLACRAIIKWAVIAEESHVDAGTIIKTMDRTISYLDASANDISQYKLLAQAYVVLSSIIEDEEKALDAFDKAVSALKNAHQIDPDDHDINNQLEDLGVEI